MKTIEFQISKHQRLSCSIPEEWNEITDRQFLAVAGITHGWLREDEFFMQFFGISSDVLARIDAFQLYTLADLLEFLHQLQPLDTFPVSRIKAEFPEGTVYLYAPGEKLKGMTFQQFMSVDTFYTWFQHTKNEDFLLSMIATLYLQENSDFVELELSKQITAIRKATVNTDEMIKAIAMQWTLIRLWLAKAYSSLFPSAPEPSQDAQPASKKNPTSWLSIFDTLVEDDLTRLETYARLPATDVLRVLNRRIRNQQKAKRKK